MKLLVALVVCFVVGVLGQEEITRVTQEAVWGYSEFTTATNFLKFSEDMYLSNDLFCLPFDDPVDATCLPCTYAADPPRACPSHVQPTSDSFSEATQEMLASVRSNPCDCLEEYVCDIPEIELGTTLEVELDDKLYSKIYRFQANSWDQGFVIKNKPKADFAPKIVVATSPTFSTESIIAESNKDQILVCPSLPLFGPASNTFTYFVSVEALRYSKSDILITFLDTDNSVGNSEDFVIDDQSFYMTNNQNLNDGAYTKLSGDYYQTNNGRPPRDNSFFLFLHPFSECGVYSFHSEFIESEGHLWKGYIYLLVNTESELASANTHSVEYLHLGATVHALSGDTVATFCPKNEDEQNFISVALIAADGPWEIDFFLRKSEESSYIQSFAISDSSLSHVEIQERLQSAFLMRFPCSNCTLNNDISAYISRRNLMTSDFFPALIDPLPDEPAVGVDLIDQVALQTEDYYYLRCVDRLRDSACGILSVYPFGDFASPLIYPALEPVRSVSPLPSLVAQDLTYLFPSRADRLSLMTFIEVRNIFTISEARYETGELQFSNPSPLHTKSFGAPPLLTVAISEMDEEPPSVCSFESFHPIYEFMEFLHGVLRAGQRSGRTSKPGNILDIDSRTANYWAYAMLWTREWQSCWDNGAALVNFGLRVTPLTNTTVCAENDPSDPCCNERLEWSECCSAEDRNLYQYQWLPLDLNEEAIEADCEDPACMETFATDFSEIYRSGIVDQICIVNNEVSSNISSIMAQCTDIYLGYQPNFGVSCHDDGDCDIFDDSNTYCDMNLKKCVVDSISQQNAFLGCLIAQMGSFTATLVYDELVESGVADPEDASGDVFLTVDLLRTALLDGEYRCLDDYGPMHDHHEYFRLVSQTTVTENSCPLCDEGGYDLKCLTTFGCAAPTQCFDLSPTCVTNFVPVEPACEAPTPVCNWDNSITVESDCTDDEYKCMYCYNSSNCITFSADKDDCDSTPICILKDGEVLWDVDEDDCEGRKRCEEGGYGESECEETGECHDVDEIYESIKNLAATHPSLDNATKGVCITPLRPQNTPPCPLLRELRVDTFDFSSLRGCVRFSECQFFEEDGKTICVHDPATEEDCVDNWGGTWLSLPIDNYGDCENPFNLDDEEAPGYCWRKDEITLLSPKNKEECESCGGYPYPPARWEGLNYGGGKSVRASWRKTEMVETYRYTISSISYFALEKLLEKAALGFENFILWSGETCLINPFLNYLDIASCECSLEGPPNPGKIKENPFTGFPLTTPTCRDELASDEIGTIWFCPGFNLRTGVISGIVTSLSNYLSGQLCFFSDILLASTSDFVGNRPSEPVTVTNDPNDLDPSPVRNQQGASVGIVLADGVKFVLATNTQPVNWNEEVGGVQLTFTIDLTIFEELGVPADYVLDFGLEVVDSSPLKTQPDGEIELRPVNAEGSTVGQPVGNFYPESEDDETLPITVDGILLDPFRYDESSRIYPIARQADWEDEELDNALSTGEVAMIGVFTGLYGVAFLATLAILIMGFSSLTLSLFLLFFYVLAVFLFRTVFWGLVAAGEYEETSAGYYILIEPPSFFILSVLTILIMSYAFIVAATVGNAEDKLGAYWCTWLLLQFFLFAVLCACIGLMIGLDTNDTINISCFGRQSTVEENTTVRDIRIAYYSFVLFVAIVCALIVIKLGRDLPSHKNKSTLQYLSALAGLAVVLTSALWLTYSIVDDPTPFFVIPLFFTEVPPLLLMSYLTFSSSQPSKGEAIDYDL